MGRRQRLGEGGGKWRLAISERVDTEERADSRTEGRGRYF